MVLVVLFLGAILLVAGIRGTYRDLFTALSIDVPGYIVWAAAILALGAIGLIPGLKPVSKGLLALVLIVLIVNNYQKIIAGFHSAVQTGEAQGSQPAQTGTSSKDAAKSSQVSIQDILSLADLGNG